MILAPSLTIANVLGHAAALIYALLALGQHRLSPEGQRTGLIAAWLVHATWVAHTLMAQPPSLGFAPALSFTVWVVAGVYAAESLLYKPLQTHASLLGLGAVVVLLGLWVPGQTASFAPSVWFTVHWALGMSAYGALGAAVAHGWWLQRTERLMRHPAGEQLNQPTALPLLAIERLTFRLATAGFALLSATLVAGMVFSEHIHGKPFNWNHKWLFSTLAWGVLAVLLVGRWQLGWRSRTAVRMLYAGAGFLLLAYVGSRFVLEVILHKAVV